MSEDQKESYTDYCNRKRTHQWLKAAFGCLGIHVGKPEVQQVAPGNAEKALLKQPVLKAPRSPRSDLLRISDFEDSEFRVFLPLGWRTFRA
jgi:hypothetical protein